MKKIVTRGTLALICALSLSTNSGAMERNPGESVPDWIARRRTAHQIDTQTAAARIAALMQGLGGAQGVDTQALEALIAQLRAQLAEVQQERDAGRTEIDRLFETLGVQNDDPGDGAEAPLQDHIQAAGTHVETLQGELTAVMHALEQALIEKAELGGLLVNALEAAEQLRAQLDARDELLVAAQEHIDGLNQ